MNTRAALGNRFTISLLATVLALLLVGCQQQTYTFNVSVKNDSARPLMVGLAKDGPPFEDNWATPEDVATFSRNADERGWGVPTMPGRTAEVPKVKGTVTPETSMYLRVYADAPSLTSMLAISRGSPNRLDIPLYPGTNDIVVSTADGKLTFKRAGQ